MIVFLTFGLGLVIVGIGESASCQTLGLGRCGSGIGLQVRRQQLDTSIITTV